ncbi:hypothetical protein BGZ49_009128 [Haplosporangium sp. Z 27]|nr:hypothetical protein BGZ49_009128 [Haplosporangium sp. Z 27]
MGVELKVDGAFDRENVSDDPLHFYHSRHYLEGVSNVNQLVDIRFVFAAHQLPRGAEFAQLLDPIRKRCMVDTYLIPHETTRVYEDQDVIFGISGTMDHVRQGIHDFLYITVPRAKMFTLWRQCLLVPRVVIHSLIGLRELSATDSTPTYPVESSVPILKKAMARIYGPIRGAKQEHLLTIESCSFSTIMNAIVFVGNMLMEHSVSQDSCHGYYRGGRRSVIPEYMRISWDKDHAKTRMDARVPAGYVLRQEMHLNLKEMHKKRYHLQFIMDIAHAEFLAGEAGAMVRSRCDSLMTDICISDGILGLKGNEDRFRVCNVSGNDLKLVGTACKEIMFWMGNMLLGEWSMNIYIPHRVVLKASEWPCVVFQHSIHSLAEAERQTRKYEPRLEPDEEESVVRIWSRNAEGFQSGILAVLEAIYVRNPNSIPTSDIQPSRNSGSE